MSLSITRLIYSSLHFLSCPILGSLRTLSQNAVCPTACWPDHSVSSINPISAAKDTGNPQKWLWPIFVELNLCILIWCKLQYFAVLIKMTEIFSWNDDCLRFCHINNSICKQNKENSKIKTFLNEILLILYICVLFPSMMYNGRSYMTVFDTTTSTLDL